MKQSISALIVLAAVASWIVMFSMVRGGVAEIRGLRRSAAADEQIAEDARAASAFLADRADDIEAMQSRFVDTQSVVRFIEAVERAGSNAGLEVSLGGVTLDAQSGKPIFTIVGGGEFSRAFRFIALLEHIAHETDILSADLVRNTTDGTWSATVRMMLQSFDPSDV